MATSWLTHPLLGVERRLTVVGIGYLVVVSMLVLASGWRRGLFLSDGQLPVVADALSWLVITLAVVTTFVVAFVYPLLNGGPGLTVAIVLAPHAMATLASGTIAADVDVALALAASGLGATIAVGHLLVRGGSEWSPTLSPGVFDGAVIATVPTLLAGVLTYRLAGVVGPHAETGFWVAVGLTLLAAAGLAVVWTVCLQHIRQTGLAPVAEEKKSRN